jgi:glycosyltransferase involved in cell wall biosynthesis
MKRIRLVQPEPGGRISGGYRYNAEMAAHGAWDLCAVDQDQLEAVVPALEADLVIADSIWLTEATVGPFLRRRAAAFLIHAFPSLVRAAERGEPTTAPTPFELQTLEAMGSVVLPGPHHAGALGGRAVEALVCEPGVGDEWRSPPRRRAGACALLSVGAVTPLKGFGDVLEALEPLAGQFRWTVVGSLDADPAYAGRFVDRARRLAGVAVLGQRSPDEVRSLVAAADLLVMPSYTENHPLVLLEAIAASVPVVAYAAGGIPALLIHGREGLLAPVGDRAALAAHLRRLIGDEAERWSMAQACWRRQATLPSWADAARAARHALERLA